MNFATFIIAALIFIPMALVLYKQFKKMKNGETGCSCGCSGCSQAEKCHSIPKNSENSHTKKEASNL